MSAARWAAVGHVNARDHQSSTAHKDSHTPGADHGSVGKQPLVEASAARAPSVASYKKQVRQFMDDLFSVKATAISTFGTPLGKSKTHPSPSFLGQALKIAIGAAGGPFVEALALGTAARTIVTAAIPLFADAVSNSVKKGGDLGNSVAVASFLTEYVHAVKVSSEKISGPLERGVTDVAHGRSITAALNGEQVDDKYLLKSEQVSRVRAQTQLETLDAWTIALQQQGDAQGKQGYSDQSTGQLHLQSLAIFGNGKLEVQSPAIATMEQIGHDAVLLNGSRPLESIPVQRTMNVIARDGEDKHFGMSVSASGRILADEFHDDDKRVLLSFYNSRKKDKTKPATVDAALHDIWDGIKTRSPRELGFAMKGA
jgi:hypothetical protein